MKTPDIHDEKPIALSSLNSTGTDFTLRQIRVINALVSTRDFISRESIDRIAGASNGPEIIRGIRRRLTGYDGLEMVLIPKVDKDGKHCRPGYYRLTDAGRKRVLLMLGGKNA